MVYLILASMGSFLWTILLIFVSMYCAAIYFTDNVTELMRNRSSNSAPMDWDAIEQHWGTLGASMISLFMAISGGDDWRNFIDIFSGNGPVHAMNMAILSTYVAFGTLVLLNLVTGVFVEGAHRILKTEGDNEMRRKADMLFRCADIDDDHNITWTEFRDRLGDDENLSQYFASVGFTLNDAKNLFNFFDEDGDRSLNLHEFVNGTLKLAGPPKVADTAKILYTLKEHQVSTDEAFKSMNQKLESIRWLCVPDPGGRDVLY